MRLLSMTRITAWTRRMLRGAWSTLGPHRHTASIVATGADLCRSRRDLLIENAVLRHQLGILRR
jgi:hypothetical protein